MRLLLKRGRLTWFASLQVILSPVQQQFHTDVLGFGFTFSRITGKAVAIWLRCPLVDVGMVWA